MKILKCGLLALFIAGAVFMIVTREHQISRLKEMNSNLEQAVNDARNVKEDPSIAKVDAGELARLKEDRAELIKLRGEVSTLRREKEEWQKRLSAEKKAAEARETVQVAQNQQAANSIQAILNAAPMEKGAFSGDLRRKILNREPLNETEQAAFMNLLQKTAEIEKSPQDFSSFQAAFIGSLLGWNNDPRAEQVQQFLLRASTAANERGFNYNTPSQNADNWDDAQKALNARATGAVQKLLTPEERNVFDKAFLGVLGIDFGVSAQPRPQ